MVWPFTFYVLDEDDLHLYLTNITTGATTEITTNFSVSPTGGSFPADSGTITYPSIGDPLTSTYKLTIVREMDVLQETEYPNNSALRPKVVERDLDRQTMISQQLKESITRALVADISSTTNYEMPAAVADGVIGWNDAGTALENKTDLSGTFPVVDVQAAIDHITDPTNAHASSAISFVQSGSGAVTRTAQDKLREEISVKDFGAKGDGTTDDYAAITAAITYAATINGTVRVPSGLYIVSDTIDITEYQFVSIIGDGRLNSLILHTGAQTTGCLQIYGGDGVVSGGLRTMYNRPICTVSDIGLGSIGGPALRYYRAWNIITERVYLFSAHASYPFLSCDGAAMNLFSDCDLDPGNTDYPSNWAATLTALCTSGQNALKITTSDVIPTTTTEQSFINCRTGNWYTGDSIIIENPAPTVFSMFGMSFVNCFIKVKSTRNGVSIINAGVKIDNTDFEGVGSDPATTAIYVGGSDTVLRISNVDSYSAQLRIVLADTVYVSNSSFKNLVVENNPTTYYCFMGMNVVNAIDNTSAGIISNGANILWFGTKGTSVSGSLGNKLVLDNIGSQLKLVGDGGYSAGLWTNAGTTNAQFADWSSLKGFQMNLANGNIRIGNNTSPDSWKLSVDAGWINSVDGYKTNGADFGEMFESADGNRIPFGVTVIAVNGKIRAAKDGESPIGAISATCSWVGNNGGNEWPGKYLRNDFGVIVEDSDGNPTINPLYDPTKEYVLRENRPEWHIVGLLGQVRILKGQPTAPGWIKLNDISDQVELWLIK
jgi:hypothetical protein